MARCKVGTLLAVILSVWGMLESVDEIIFRECKWENEGRLWMEGNVEVLYGVSAVRCAAACLSEKRCVSVRYSKWDSGENCNSSCSMRNESGALSEGERQKGIGTTYFKDQGITKVKNPSGFSKVGDEVLRISTKVLKYREAEVLCAAYKGAIILSPVNTKIASTFQRIMTAYRETTMKEGIWIGIDRRNLKKDLMLSMGNTWKSEKFLGQFFESEDVGNPGEDCGKLVILPDDSLNIQWENCSRPLHFICQHFGRNFAAGKEGTAVMTNVTYLHGPIGGLSNIKYCQQTTSEIGVWFLVDLAVHHVVHAVRVTTCLNPSESTGLEVGVGYEASIYGNNLCKFFNNRLDPEMSAMLRCEPCPLSGQYVTLRDPSRYPNIVNFVAIEVYGSEIRV